MSHYSRTLTAALAVATLGAVFAGTGLAQGGPCEDCGPGPHWVDNCLGGLDEIGNQNAVIGIDVDFDCVEDMSLVLFPCPAPDHLLVISRTDPLDDSLMYPGLRSVDGHFDVIDTEIVHMCLKGAGFTLTAGAGLGQGGVLGPSYGAVAEVPSGGPDFPADSFFDVLFEVELPGGGFLYNQVPLRVETEIFCVPPDDAAFVAYEHCLPLYTSPIPEQGVYTANLTTAEHYVNPGTSPVQESSWSVIKGLYR